MRVSLALGKPESLAPQTAWGCLTTNLTLPGFGSIMGGRRSGYPQVALTLVGLGLTSVFGIHFIFWSITNWSRLHGPQADPFDTLQATWQAMRWAALGIGVFAISWLWALMTGLSLVREAQAAKRAGSKPVPPRLTDPPPGPGTAG